MKRAIVDYKKLTKDILALLVEKYPEGYQDHDVIRFKNAKNETVEALEVRTEDTIYLVKVSTRLATSMERYDEDDYYSDTLEMSREDEIALKRKKDISKTSLHIDDEEEEEEEEEHYRDDYHDQREDDDDEEDEEDEDEEDEEDEEDDD